MSEGSEGAMGEETMSDEQPKPQDELLSALVDAAVWMESASIRMDAIESLLKKQGLTDEDLAKAFREAAEAKSALSPDDYQDDQFGFWREFLRRETKR